MKRTLIAVGAASLLLLVGCSSESDPEPAAAPASSATAAPAKPRAAAPAAQVADPRCAPAGEDVVIAVANGLKDDSLTLKNAQVIVDGDLTFLGASAVRPDGKFENRSDVWVLSGMLPTAATGGARSMTEWPKTSEALKITPADERVQAVDSCVVKSTLN
ncbi:hypothetical protein C8K38_111181 [Rhodococcus sp. OK611]|uniref:hypothetical protein n=1 Tax=unclassified Rhodococcus (in: high G+C Gram-positive bacteria) TaxID=192944 RepID=UPI000BC92513|nr:MULTISPECIES: hypothetical protein [unclassified Rhodococcus (in: high G+C Gram-positive bacteria)]PTR42012.1 hypothetical protein C8K38_111181 [Rhodococcus sp. OK611]SNX91541.1 hypothetical protein SAMN05447004_11076 [Rhodococcus sp. OK270]